MSEAIIPFYIPPKGVAPIGVITIPDPSVNTAKNLLQVCVLSGGPVFGWTGRRTAGEANNDIHPSDPASIEFDFAGNLNCISEFTVGELSAFTLASDNESWGYIRVVELG